jgi:hypothetical protein
MCFGFHESYKYVDYMNMLKRLRNINVSKWSLILMKDLSIPQNVE